MRNNSKVQTLLIILVLALGLGYAYINSDLNINGTAQVNSANWDVHWANVQVSTGSVSASSPTISNQTTVNYSVVLDQPGDYYEFTVDAVNGGTIDAMIDSIDSKLNGVTITTLPDYLDYTVTYEDGVELEPNHLLAANTTETYKVNIKYRDDIELNQIPATNQNLSLEFTVTYRQATEDAIEVGYSMIRYTTNIFDGNFSTLSDGTNTSVAWIGKAPTVNIDLHNTAEAAMAAFSNSSSYLKHKFKNGIVTESYACFEKNGNSWCLRGAAPSDLVDGVSPYFESNIEIMRDSFGESNCVSYGFDLSCNEGGFYVEANGYGGQVQAGYGLAYCLVDNDGDSYCNDE